MIIPSLLYTAVTILLTFIDACRIKAVWGKKDNIDHNVSTALAMAAAPLVMYVFYLIQHPYIKRYVNTDEGVFHWVVLYIPTCIAIRIIFYDLVLNIFRLLMRTNPTLRLDYESSTTSSNVDKETHDIPFWDKRVLAIASWFVLFLIYRYIFKLWY